MSQVPTSGGKVVVSLRKEAELFEPSGDMCDLFIAWKSQVPQGFWDSGFLSKCQRIVGRTVNDSHSCHCVSKLFPL